MRHMMHMVKSRMKIRLREVQMAAWVPTTLYAGTLAIRLLLVFVVSWTAALTVKLKARIA